MLDVKTSVEKWRTRPHFVIPTQKTIFHPRFSVLEQSEETFITIQHKTLHTLVTIHSGRCSTSYRRLVQKASLLAFLKITWLNLSWPLITRGNHPSLVLNVWLNLSFLLLHFCQITGSFSNSPGIVTNLVDVDL